MGTHRHEGVVEEAIGDALVRERLHESRVAHHLGHLPGRAVPKSLPDTRARAELWRTSPHHASALPCLKVCSIKKNLVLVGAGASSGLASAANLVGYGDAAPLVSRTLRSSGHDQVVANTRLVA